MTNGITLEEILEHANLSKALSRVEANRGAPGVDRMGTDELRDYISAHPHELTSAIIKGTYRPSPVLRVSIPKEDRVNSESWASQQSEIDLYNKLSLRF